MAVLSTFETWPYAFVLVNFVKNKIILIKIKVLFEFNDYNSVSGMWLFLDNQQDVRKKVIE